MRYLALATDYDGTLAHHGRVSEETFAGLEDLLASGRKLILVTGRELDDLFTVFDRPKLFEWIVAENGALLYRPATREEKLLGERPKPEFVERLRQRGVAPMSVGRVIVATWRPHETTVLETIRDMGLELQVIFNKDAVMVLPAGINKATGLAAALKEMGLSPHNVVGIGDAENDHAFLKQCECSAAVANALPAVKEQADLATRGDHGAGVVELIGMLEEDDLRRLEPRLTRHHILLGTRAEGGEVHVPPFGESLLIAGSSGGGKSELTTGLLERLVEKQYQFCVIDPEGDYERFPLAVPLGTTQRAPAVEEVLQLLKSPGQNAVVSLVGLPVMDRPRFFLGLLTRLQEMRALTGRPHWVVVDETHHVLPADWQPASKTLPKDLHEMVYITVHPNQVAPAVLATVGTALIVGKEPQETLNQFAAAVGREAPDVEDVDLPHGEALVWDLGADASPFRIKAAPARSEHLRHTRKYAEGELPPERSFYFRGPEGKLHLRAQNLILFMQLADGVDDDTWTYHLRRGEYSRWFRDAIRDEELAGEAEGVEGAKNLSPKESRKRLKELIQRHYTLPASSPLPIPGTPAEVLRE